jgi:hypothetical protein
MNLTKKSAIILSIVVILIFISILIPVVFYYYPVPLSIQKRPGKISRCIDSDGILYKVEYSCDDCGYGLFNGKGETICSMSTWTSGSQDCKKPLCFSLDVN